MNHLVSLPTMSLAVFLLSTPLLAEEFALHFGPEEIIQADGNDIVVPGYSVPSFVDWNNDDLKDLVIGEGGAIGTVAPGKVRVYLNVGTAQEPRFKDYFYVRSVGGDLTLTPDGCMGCFPRVVDWDEDGRNDLLVGVSDGTVRIYTNITDNSTPSFDDGTNVKVGISAPRDLDVGMRATPLVVDWNQDTLLDVVVGGWDGLIHVFENCGCGGSVPPRFSLTTPTGMYAQEDGHHLIVPSARSSPVVMDFDKDGKLDLLTGNTNGQILFYRNVGTAFAPAFSGYTPVPSSGQPIDLGGAQRSRPFVCHWTSPSRSEAQDGYWDLLVGYGDGKIRLYRGVPKLGDLDGDGALDGDDLTILAKALDQPVLPTGSPADLNADGVVDARDLRLFVDLWLVEHEAATE